MVFQEAMLPLCQYTTRYVLLIRGKGMRHELRGKAKIQNTDMIQNSKDCMSYEISCPISA